MNAADRFALAMRAQLQDELDDAGHQITVPDPLYFGQVDEWCQLLGTKVSDLVHRAEQRLPRLDEGGQS